MSNPLTQAKDPQTDFSEYVYTSEEATNALLIIVSTGFIFLMQAGFAMVEVGSVRQKNAHNILIKNLFDAVAGAIAFWLVGYGFAFGQRGEKGGFIGDDPQLFAASGFDDTEFNHYLQWIFQFSFAATSTTIVSGSLAERT
jgi:ammonium transporter, Amt family